MIVKTLKDDRPTFCRRKTLPNYCDREITQSLYTRHTIIRLELNWYHYPDGIK
jgi:hypothetical protein